MPYRLAVVSFIALGFLQISLCIPVGTHNEASHPGWGHDFTFHPTSPELYKSSANEVDLDNIDFGELYKLMSSEPQQQSNLHMEPVQSVYKRPHSSIVGASMEMHPDVGQPSSIWTNTVGSTTSSASLPTYDHHMTQGYHQKDDVEFANRYHIFKKYPWQAKISEKKLREIYLKIGSQWKPLPRSSLMDALGRLGQKIEDNPNIIESLLRGDQKTIDWLTEKTYPTFTKNTTGGKKGLFTVERMLSGRHIQSAVKGNYLTNPILRKRPNAKPRWAPIEMDANTAKRFVQELQKKWNTAEVNTRTSLYRKTHEQIKELISQVLPDHSIDGSAITFQPVKRRRTAQPKD
jgi:hypothetical protein